MESLYLYHHLGMGDHILCNGLVRHFAKLYKKTYVFAKPNYAKNVLYMYRDNSNIKIIPFDDSDVKVFMNLNPDNNYLILGHTPDYFYRLDKLKEFTFEEGFYKMAKIPIEYKWSKFYFERNLEKEKESFKKLGLSEGEKYIFVHDDPKRQRIFKTKYIDKSLKAIHPSDHQDIGLFDFFYTIENAYEIHVHNSSFDSLIDCMEIKRDRMFYHRYARPDCPQVLSKNIDWIIYD
jgi:hypothetical protein